MISIVIVLPGAAAAERRADVIRVLSPNLAETLQEMSAHSPAARALVDQLERSDLLIHVTGLNRRDGFTGTLNFVVRAGSRRVLRIAIDQRLPPDRRAAALAHELHHALEVAREPSVIDHASLAAHYRHIGYESGGHPGRRCFETVDALRAGARVLAEFRASTAVARRAARAVAASNGSR